MKSAVLFLPIFPAFYLSHTDVASAQNSVTAKQKEPQNKVSLSQSNAANITTGTDCTQFFLPKANIQNSIMVAVAGLNRDTLLYSVGSPSNIVSTTSGYHQGWEDHQLGKGHSL